MRRKPRFGDDQQSPMRLEDEPCLSMINHRKSWDSLWEALVKLPVIQYQILDESLGV